MTKSWDDYNKGKTGSGSVGSNKTTPDDPNNTSPNSGTGGHVAGPGVDPRNLSTTTWGGSHNPFSLGGRRDPTAGYSHARYEDLLRQRHVIAADPSHRDYGMLVVGANKYWSQPQFAGWNTQQRRQYATDNFGTQWGSSGPQPTPNQMPQNRWGDGPLHQFMPGQSNNPFGLTRTTPDNMARVQPTPAQQQQQGGGGWGDIYNHRPQDQWADGMLPASRPATGPNRNNWREWYAYLRSRRGGM